MIVKIDWISFSIPMPGELDNDQQTAKHIVSAVDDLHPKLSEWLALETEFTARNGRAPYSIAWQRADSGLTVFAHPSLSHALIEISGRGCETLSQSGNMDAALQAVANRVTRLDIACDVVTDARPSEFTEKRHVGRFKAHSTVVSESGETVYIGARSSDRYARVYRYNEPHERAHLLRCEFVIKADNAKLIIPTLLEEGLLPVAAALGETFGWQHETWRVESDPAELTTFRPERREGKTLFWLADTIAPLLVRLHREGVLDIDAWLADHVRPKLQG